METNDTQKIVSMDKNKYGTLGALTVLNVIVGIICLSNPKACFGSCPTFYIDDNPNANLFSSDAEGFSEAIAPFLEYSDLDALQYTIGGGQIAKLRMKNEAQETHVVNSVNLLAIPEVPGTHVFHDKDNIFYRCSGLKTPEKATGPEGSILEAVKSIDETERRSVTDSLDMAAKETIELEFDAEGLTNPALVINFRQTLLTTFLLYSVYTFMGDEMSDIFARIQSSKKVRQGLGTPFKKIKFIEVYVEQDKPGNWKKVYEFGETGPIAWNLQAIPLSPVSDSPGSTIRVKLVLNKGLWRIDYLALADIVDYPAPVKLYPNSIRYAGAENPGLKASLLEDDERYVVSFPGDNYEMGFLLPAEKNSYELFLIAKGYYLEWIREDWIKGKDIGRLRKIAMDDKKAWEELSLEYKLNESGMEEVFWDSKLVIP
jgi:hypothetical protein